MMVKPGMKLAVVKGPDRIPFDMMATKLQAHRVGQPNVEAI